MMCMFWIQRNSTTMHFLLLTSHAIVIFHMTVYIFYWLWSPLFMMKYFRLHTSTNCYGILIQFINLSSYPILKCASVSSLLLLFNVKRFHGVIYMRSFPFVCVCINTKLVQILKMLIRQESVFRVCKMN